MKTVSEDLAERDHARGVRRIADIVEKVLHRQRIESLWKCVTGIEMRAGDKAVV